MLCQGTLKNQSCPLKHNKSNSKAPSGIPVIRIDLTCFYKQNMFTFKGTFSQKRFVVKYNLKYFSECDVLRKGVFLNVDQMTLSDKQHTCFYFDQTKTSCCVCTCFNMPVSLQFTYMFCSVCTKRLYILRAES